MKGDFSRNTFDPLKHFSRVLMQQGRVQLDADWNEQADIILHYLRTLARDLIGDHGGPRDGFSIDKGTHLGMDFAILPGRYYVDGILCENEKLDLTFKGQDSYPFPDSEELESGRIYLVYLDVWERHITHFEDARLREVALGGPDTATRTKVVWQVKVTSTMPDGQAINGDQKTNWAEWLQDLNANWDKWKARWHPVNRGKLKASNKDARTSDAQPCIISPESRYRGAENQLYRVEIHTSGTAGKATFKWSRDNGTVVFPLSNLTGQRAKMAQAWRDDRHGLKIGDWVEIVDDDRVLRGESGILAQVDAVKLDDMTIVLKFPDKVSPPQYQASDYNTKHVLLRRWDHKIGNPNSSNDIPKAGGDGALSIEEDKPLTLEDGIQIFFESANADNNYRSGDYWLIPARTATGDVEWPKDESGSVARAPHGIEHHYAPLGIIECEKNGDIFTTSFRLPISPAAHF